MSSVESLPLLDHPQLRSASRVSGSRDLLSDLMILAACGCAAALMVALIDLNLKIPGHAILKGTFPIALGLALVPRRFSGMAISASAMGTLMTLKFFTTLDMPGGGSTTSLLLLGPMLDLLLWGARPGLNTIVRFVLAGLLTNLIAFAIRFGGKVAFFAAIDIVSWDRWKTVAPWTHLACGIAAGLVSSVILFRMWPRAEDSAPTQDSSTTGAA